MAVIHKDLPDSELHEPKGASSASKEDVYVADGEGGGDWSTGGGFHYAGMLFTTGGDLTINTVGTDVLVQGTNLDTPASLWSSITSNGAEFGNTGDEEHIQVARSGTYLVNFGVEITGTGDSFNFGVAKNGSRVADHPGVRTDPASAAVGRVEHSSIYQFNQGDTVQLVVQNEDATTNLTLNNATFSVVLLKET